MWDLDRDWTGVGTEPEGRLGRPAEPVGAMAVQRVGRAGPLEDPPDRSMVTRVLDGQESAKSDRDFRLFHKKSVHVI